MGGQDPGGGVDAVDAVRIDVRRMGDQSAGTLLSASPEEPGDGAVLDVDGRGVAGDHRGAAPAAGVRTELASLETRLIRWMVGTVIATATLTVGILRLLWMTTSKVPRPQAAI